MKKQSYYMAALVIERLEDGRMKAWYPQEQRRSLREAKADAVTWSKENPGSEYQVVRVTMAEVGAAKLRPEAAT